MKNYILTFFILISNIDMTYAQSETILNNRDIEEFKLVSFCHCIEYLKIRSIDYEYFKSPAQKLKYLENIENVVFSDFLTERLFGQNYQTKYDSSVIFKLGISVYFKGDLNFKRLDSLYFEPLVQHYVSEHSKTENLPYLGFDRVSYFFDCYHRVNEIPLEQELLLFKKLYKLE